MERSLEGLSCRVLASIGPALISAGNVPEHGVTQVYQRASIGPALISAGNGEPVDGAQGRNGASIGPALISAGNAGLLSGTTGGVIASIRPALISAGNSSNSLESASSTFSFNWAGADQRRKFQPFIGTMPTRFPASIGPALISAGNWRRRMDRRANRRASIGPALISAGNSGALVENNVIYGLQLGRR